jgi:tryptophan-rich sensory protein
MTLTIIVVTLFVVAAMGAGGLMTDIGDWYRQLRKPWFNPPNWVFGPAWALILGLAGWSAVLAWTRAHDQGQQLVLGALFSACLVLQVAWSPLFFKFKRPDWALLEIPLLWASILVLIIVIAPISIRAAMLLAPYLAWVTFATLLNLVIVRMNGPFGRSSTKATARTRSGG